MFSFYLKKLLYVRLKRTRSKQKCITSFTPTYQPIISEIHNAIRKNLGLAVDSIEQLKELLPLDTIKLSLRRDRNLKEMLAPPVPYNHHKDQESSQLGSCLKCGSQRCGLCKMGVSAETNK